ncbi:MAG TPA: acyl carrier protein [Alphaproteobacteria bacterium]|nr:acyl carrier protein [Alphaproteobacteria bacterium]
MGSFPEWDSMAHFNFLLRIEETYGIRFTVDEMMSFKSLADIDKVLRAKSAA